MIKKYQQGGQLTDTQQQGLQYLAQMYAQQTGKDPQQDQEGFMQFVQQLAQQAGVQNIGQLLDMIYQQAQGQAQAAKHGAKLNYLRKLTDKCPEGTELVYFKAGGRVCSQCVAKKKIDKEACGKKIKKNCGGKKLKFQEGNKINDKADYSKPNKKITATLNGKKINLTVNEGQLYGEDPVNVKGQNYYLTGDSTLIKSNQNKNNNKKVINKKVVKDQEPAGPINYENTVNKLGFKLPEDLKGYWLYPGVTITGKRGGNRPFLFDRRTEDWGLGYNRIADIIYDIYDEQGDYKGDYSGIRGGRIIYQTPYGNDTIYGGDEGPYADVMYGVPEGTSQENPYFHGSIPLPSNRKNQK